MGRDCRNCYRRNWTGSLGQAEQLQAQGYQADMNKIMIFTLLSLVGLVLGIMLLVKNTKVANTLSVVCLLIVLLAVMSGDTIGVVILAKVLAIVSAHKIVTLWNA